MVASAAPALGSATRAAQAANKASTASRGGSSVSGSSQGGSSGAGSAASGSRGSSSRAGGGSSASSGKAYKAAKRRRTCKTCPDWRYEMGIRRLGGVPYVYQWHHLFVTAWNRGGTGIMPTFSAFPSNENGAAGLLGPLLGSSQSDSSKTVEENYAPNENADGDFGFIKFTPFPDYYSPVGEYDPGNRFVTLLDTKENLTAKLTLASTAISARKIKYVPTGPNSNSFAMSVAERAGLPRKKPAGDAPGSGIKL